MPLLVVWICSEAEMAVTIKFTNSINASAVTQQMARCILLMEFVVRSTICLYSLTTFCN